MRKFLCSTLSCLLLLTACSTSPERYEAEIVDSVKMEIACADYMAEVLSNPLKNLNLSFVLKTSYDAFAEQMNRKIDDIYLTHQEEANGYRFALATMAETEKDGFWKRVARDLLKEYDELDVTLSDYKEIKSGKVWQFKELRTGVTFIFEISKEKGQEIWTCESLGNELSDYIEAQIY